MNAADLTEAERILALCERITPGPWFMDHWKVREQSSNAEIAATWTCLDPPEVGRYNAAAITELPRLAALLRLALRENEGMREAMECIASSGSTRGNTWTHREQLMDCARAALAGSKET